MSSSEAEEDRKRISFDDYLNLIEFDKAKVEEKIVLDYQSDDDRSVGEVRPQWSKISQEGNVEPLFQPRTEEFLHRMRADLYEYDVDDSHYHELFHPTRYAGSCSSKTRSGSDESEDSSSEGELEEVRRQRRGSVQHLSSMYDELVPEKPRKPISYQPPESFPNFSYCDHPFYKDLESHDNVLNEPEEVLHQRRGQVSNLKNTFEGNISYEPNEKPRRYWRHKYPRSRYYTDIPEYLRSEGNNLGTVSNTVRVYETLPQQSFERKSDTPSKKPMVDRKQRRKSVGVIAEQFEKGNLDESDDTSVASSDFDFAKETEANVNEMRLMFEKQSSYEVKEEIPRTQPKPLSPHVLKYYSSRKKRRGKGRRRKRRCARSDDVEAKAHTYENLVFYADDIPDKDTSNEPILLSDEDEEKAFERRRSIDATKQNWEKGMERDFPLSLPPVLYNESDEEAYQEFRKAQRNEDTVRPDFELYSKDGVAIDLIEPSMHRSTSSSESDSDKVRRMSVTQRAKDYSKQRRKEIRRDRELQKWKPLKYQLNEREDDIYVTEKDDLDTKGVFVPLRNDENISPKVSATHGKHKNHSENFNRNQHSSPDSRYDFYRSSNGNPGSSRDIGINREQNSDSSRIQAVSKQKNNSDSSSSSSSDDGYGFQPTYL